MQPQLIHNMCTVRWLMAAIWWCVTPLSLLLSLLTFLFWIDVARIVEMM